MCLECLSCNVLAVHADRMRGGRNKFGPMYKRDRAMHTATSIHLASLNGSPCGKNTMSPPNGDVINGHQQSVIVPCPRTDQPRPPLS